MSWGLLNLKILVRLHDTITRLYAFWKHEWYTFLYFICVWHVMPWFLNKAFCLWLQKEIARRDQKVDQLHHDIQLTLQEKESVTRALKQQIADLHERLRVVGERGVRINCDYWVILDLLKRTVKIILSDLTRESKIDSLTHLLNIICSL